MERMMVAVLVAMVTLACGAEGSDPNPPEPSPRVGLGAACSPEAACAGGLTCRAFYTPGGGTYSRCSAACLLDAAPGEASFCGGCARPEDEGDAPVFALARADAGLCYPGHAPLGEACRYTDDCDEGACWSGTCSLGPPAED